MNDIFTAGAVGKAPAKPERERFEPGWYRDLSNERYHGSAGVSSTRIKTLIDRTPAHYLHGMHNPSGSTPATELGSAFHTLTLEPHLAEQEIFVMPELNLRTKDGREQKAKLLEQHEGKAILKPEQFEQAEAMANAARSHETAAILLQDIIAESSVYFWYDSTDPDDGTQYRQMAKVRPDAINPAHRLVIDLNSAEDATYSGFQKAIAKYYYHLSAAMYLQGVNQCAELLQETGCYAYTKFIWIVVESKPPYTVGVYEADPEMLALGRTLLQRAMHQLHRAKSENFPGLPAEVRVIELPTWAKRLPIV